MNNRWERERGYEKYRATCGWVSRYSYVFGQMFRTCSVKKSSHNPFFHSHSPDRVKKNTLGKNYRLHAPVSYETTSSSSTSYISYSQVFLIHLLQRKATIYYTRINIIYGWEKEILSSWCRGVILCIEGWEGMYFGIPRFSPCTCRVDRPMKQK